MFLADVLLIVLVGLFVLFGLFFGAVHTLGSVVGTALGIVVSTRLIDQAFERFGFLLGGGTVARIVLFIILFLLVSRLTGILFWIVEKMFGIFAMVPFAKSLNRLIGGILGFVEGVVVVGVVTYYALQYLPDGVVRASLEQSSVAAYLLMTATALQMLFPEGVRVLK
jgi:uncharacterized membrane protein required for colicin V production